MPKKKTGQRRKAEKQKLRQKEIRTAKDQLDLAKFPCNAVMASIIIQINSTMIQLIYKRIIKINIFYIINL